MSKYMLTGIHFLLTYKCNLECDHCFLFCGPTSQGTFTLAQIQKVYDELVKIGTIKWVYFEGGEPFLFYPIMQEALRIAHKMGFKTGIVTNSYWATAVEDSQIWLKPLKELGISDFTISDDLYHSEDEKENPAKRGLTAAKQLGMSPGSICIEKPSVRRQTKKGAPVIKGGAMFRGRAVEKLIKELPTKKYEEFTECPYEDLKSPERVHLDSYGNVHLCQGLSMGNMWETSLSELVKNYDPDAHPICGPLLKGGPVLLARKYRIKPRKRYVDACHFCYSVRLALVDKFPKYLAPRQVYNLK